MPKIDVPYTEEGEELVENIKEDVQNVGGEIDYAPGGTYDGGGRVKQMYAGGGQTGYNAIGAERPMYDKGGKVDEKEDKPGIFKKFGKDVKAAVSEFTKNPREDLKKIGKALKKIKLTKTKVGYDAEGNRVEKKVPVKLKKDKKKKEKKKDKPVADKKVADKPVAPPKKDEAKKVVKTKGGDYPVYKKDSKPAKSFRSAFASARKAGKKTFSWDGRTYTTEVK